MKKKNNNLFPQPNNTSNENAGFSLVELLIAVIILAIIVVPMLHGYVTSARMNGKARQTQRAITVAQDIMEGLKAYDIEELKAQFNDPVNGFYVMDLRLIHGSIEEDYFEKMVTGDEDEDVTYHHVAKEEVQPGVYYFTLEGVQIQGSEYDALIRIDATGYETAGLKHNNAFNNDDIASPNSVIKGKDGSYVQSVGQDLSAAKEVQKAWDLESEEAGQLFTFQVFANQGGDVTRTITLTLENDGVDEAGKACCKASVQYAYECTYNGLLCPDQITGDFPKTGTVPCGDKIPEGGNIYLFYYPLYKERGSALGSITDEIVIKNETGRPYTVYIVKQVDSVTLAKLSDYQLKTAEEQYAPIVKGTPEITVRTNLGTNLVASAYVGGDDLLKDKLATDEANMEKQIIPANGQITRFTGITEILGLSQMEDGNVTEVIYDIEICIYKKGAKNKDFEDCRPVIVIKGSKNN